MVGLKFLIPTFHNLSNIPLIFKFYISNIPHLFKFQSSNLPPLIRDTELYAIVPLLRQQMAYTYLNSFPDRWPSLHILSNF